MNQDFTVQKKSNIWQKKKFVQRGSPEKKKFLHKQWAKKKNSCKLKIPHPPPPHHFSNGPSLKKNHQGRRPHFFRGIFLFQYEVRTKSKEEEKEEKKVRFTKDEVGLPVVWSSRRQARGNRTGHGYVL